jgi:hyperosmotically inducible protein
MACSTLLAVFIAGVLAGCSTASTKSPDVAGKLRTSLSQAGLKSVSVSQDRDKGVVTLGGNVPSDGDRTQADSIARSIAPDQVVANQIAVLPPGVTREAKKIDTDIDKAIGNNLDAVLIQNRLHDRVKYSVKNSVVTLTGDVASEADRKLSQRVASSVPNVAQVVNELQVKKQKATSSD